MISTWDSNVVSWFCGSGILAASYKHETNRNTGQYNRKFVRRKHLLLLFREAGILTVLILRVGTEKPLAGEGGEIHDIDTAALVGIEAVAPIVAGTAITTEPVLEKVRKVR